MSVNGPTSLKERLSRRRQALQQHHVFVVPVRGYEGIVAGRYRQLSYHEIRHINRVNAHLDDTAEGDIATATDTLIMACDELLEDTGQKDDQGKPVYKALGMKWGERAVRELFGVDDIPVGTQPREALQWVLPVNQLMLHYRDYDVEMTNVLENIDRDMLGESEASTMEREISSDWQPQQLSPASQ
jgi:hypothetical protein